MKLLCLLVFLLCGTQGFPQVSKAQTILLVVAHPDDESAIGEVLIKYRNAGNRVVVMIATDGKDGTRVTKIPAGDLLGNLRKKESICACTTMGLEPPIFLSIERLDTKIGVGNYFKAHKLLLAALKEQISKLQPDIILTFGPDGDTHHSEHIVIGASVTELLLSEGWVDKYPLYYIAWTKSQGEALDLGYVNQQYINVTIEYTSAEELQALESMQCYVTQYTKEELVTDRASKLSDTTNSISFRRFTTGKGLKQAF